jgi:hypothetical protein
VVENPQKIRSHTLKKSGVCSGENSAPILLRDGKLFLATIDLWSFYNQFRANKRLVTRHLFAVSDGFSSSQKIEFGSKPAGL